MATDEDLVFNDESEIDGPDDVSFPDYVHHLKVQSELTKLRTRGLIDDDEADRIYAEWLENRGE